MSFVCGVILKVFKKTLVKSLKNFCEKVLKNNCEIGVKV
jgi:hypothetical protein